MQQQQSRDERRRDIGVWSSIIPVENQSNIIGDTEAVVSDEESDQVAEVRAWSRYDKVKNENILGEGPTREEKRLLSSTNERKHQQSKEDLSGVERILSFIDGHRPPRKKKVRLTWNTFLGSMSQFEQIYSEQTFLRNWKLLRLLVVFFDSVFRGLGQVMFANNPLSGIVIMIGLFAGNWELSLYGLLGTCVSTLTAHILGANNNSIRAGLFGYNGCLTAMGIAYFSHPNSPQLIGPIVLMSAFSTIFAMSIGKILVQRLEIAPFTFSFQVCVWTWLLASQKYRYFFIDGTILSPNLLKTFTEKPVLLNISVPNYTAKDHFVGFFSSISQVYFIANPYTGAVILVGVALCSRILSFFALFGAVTGQLSAAYFFGLSPSSIFAGLWGYNTVLTCQALGGMFFVLYGYRIWLLTLYGSIMTLIVQTGLSSFLSPCGMPTLTFPFTFICWIFCLIAGSNNLIAVKLSSVSIPEDHYKRYALSRLVKSQLKLLNHLKDFSSSVNEDITWEELSKIQKIFVPVLMCSYTYQNDLNHLKFLIKENGKSHLIDQNNRSPLHISASEGYLKITKWLIEYCHLNINGTDQFGNSPLYDALSNGHFHLLEYLYSHGGRLPGSKSKEFAFYLNGFAFDGYVEGIETFLACGLNPNVSDFDGRNLLHILVINNQYSLMKYFIEEYPIWLDMNDYFHQRAMDYASRLSDQTICNYLIDLEKNSPIPKNLFIDNLKILKNLCSQYEHLKEEKDDDKTTKRKSIGKCLFPTIFHLISNEKENDLIEKLIDDQNVDEFIDYDGHSILHNAVKQGQLERIRFLSQFLSREEFLNLLNKEDRWGLSPVDYAFHLKHFHLIEFFNSLENLQYEMQCSSTICKKFVEELNKWKKIYFFIELSCEGQSEYIEYLFLKKSFSPDEFYEDYHQRNPMHFAAANGHLNVIEVLIKYHFKGINKTNRWGLTPQDEAKQKHFHLIIQRLNQF